MTIHALQLKDPLDELIEAYNARDVKRFLACFSEDIVIEDGRGQTLLVGHAEMRNAYFPLFQASPDLHCRVVSRTRIGEYIVDEEHISGFVKPGSSDQVRAVIIYHLSSGKIDHVRMLR